MKRLVAFHDWAMTDAPFWVGLLTVFVICLSGLAVFVSFILALVYDPLTTVIVIVFALALLARHAWQMFVESEKKE